MTQNKSELNNWYQRYLDTIQIKFHEIERLYEMTTYV